MASATAMATKTNASPTKVNATPSLFNVQRAPATEAATVTQLPRFATSLGAVPANPMVQRKCAGCEEEDNKVQRQMDDAQEQNEEVTVQPKLEVGPAGDKYEQEADAIADRVMAMPAGEVMATSSQEGVQCSCATCGCDQDSDLVRRNMDVESDEEEVRAKPANANLGTHISASANKLTACGSPLPDKTRAFFEARMGRDLSGVRIHSGGKEANNLNTSIAARAFTYSNHIWLGANESTSPSHMMAHELAHVMQQTARRATGPIADATTHVRPVIQRAAPVIAGLSIGAIAAKCILSAIAGVLFDGAIQAVLHSIKEWTWRFWEATWDYCSMILSAIIGCIAAPISAATLKPWLAVNLGPKLGKIQGTLIGKVLLFLAEMVGMGIPKFIVKSLAKLGCISPEQAAELGVKKGSDEGPKPDEPTPEPSGADTMSCKTQVGDVRGNERVLMKVDSTDFLNRNEEAKFLKFADSLRGSDDSVVIHGLASIDGPAKYNDRLSCSRAVTAKSNLISLGISNKRIKRTVKHGEVSGPKQWQRSIVLELVPGGTTDPVSPTPNRPTPDRPGVGAIVPQVSLDSLTFISDHGILKDNKTDWNGTGKHYPQPEWKAGNRPTSAAPITQVKGSRISAIATLNVEPKNTLPVSMTLRGYGPRGFLTFEGHAFLGGGKQQQVSISALQSLPDEIDSYLSQSILWAIEIGDQRILLDTSYDQDFFAIYGDPRRDLTYKRVAKAVELTRGFGRNPHKIMTGQMSRFPFYNLKKEDVIRGEPWQLADHIPGPSGKDGKGSDCQSIVRFIMAVNSSIGMPGKAKGIAVYADPRFPEVPKTANLRETGGAEGGMFDYPGYALFDAGDNANNYEAAMQFSTAGNNLFPADWRVEKFYPGGVEGGQGLSSTKKVLHVFKQLATVGVFEMTVDGKPKLESFPETTIWCYKNDSPKCDD